MWKTTGPFLRINSRGSFSFQFGSLTKNNGEYSLIRNDLGSVSGSLYVVHLYIQPAWSRD